MAAHGEFDRIGDDFAADQAGLHPLMAHGDAVGDGDGVEAARHAAAFLDTGAGDVGLMIERGVAGRAVVTGGCDADEGAGDFLRGQAHRVIIAAMRRALGPHRDMAAGQLRFVEAVGHGGVPTLKLRPFA